MKVRIVYCHFGEVHTKYYREQKFPANGTVVIRHEYKPNVGGGSLNYEENPDISHLTDEKRELGEDCVDEKVRTYLKKNKDKYGWDAIWVSYILLTANNWKTPIKDFHLIIDKKEGEVLSLCFDGTVRKTGPLRYEASIQYYYPTRNLKAIFLKKNRAQ